MNANIGDFKLLAQDGAARRGSLVTAHGVIETPAFMPVGTQASVKSLCPEDLRQIGAQIILGNTYHLHLRPGDELIAELGGLHKFMSFERPILTDSGGYQVFSLAGLRKLTPEGVQFSSHIDGSKRFFTPESVVAIQRNLGSDIMMVLDECLAYGASREATEKSLELTTKWAKQAREAYPPGTGPGLLFGIAQGGFFRDLRERSLSEIVSAGFDGYALGGLSVGEPRPEMYEILEYICGQMPADKPRYLMGVGTPQDILVAVSLGIDMFDCVLPTRNARNGTLYTSLGKLNIKRSEFKRDDTALDPDCACYTCRNFSRAYLRHLYMAQELLSYRLNTLHNLSFFLNLAARARQAIEEGSYASFMSQVLKAYPLEGQSDA